MEEVYYHRGLGLRKSAATLGVSHVTFLKYARLQGLRLRTRIDGIRRRRFTDEERERSRQRMLALIPKVQRRKSRLEAEIKEILSDAGIDVKWQGVAPALRGTLHRYHHSDFVVRGEPTAIEVNGCYWHGCPHTRRVPWSEIVTKHVARDEEIAQLLHDAGWNLVVVWEHEIRSRVPCHVRSSTPSGSTLIGAHATRYFDTGS